MAAFGLVMLVLVVISAPFEGPGIQRAIAWALAVVIGVEIVGRCCYRWLVLRPEQLTAQIYPYEIKGAVRL